MFDSLRAIQREFGYLPAERLAQLSKRINVPVSQIHAVASFYPHFRLTPPARAEVRVCLDMSCHLRGADDLLSGVKHAFAGAAPDDVAISNVSCLGRCDHAPVLAINDTIFADVIADGVVSQIRDVLHGSPLPSPRVTPPRVSLASDPYGGRGQYQVVAQ